MAHFFLVYLKATPWLWNRSGRQGVKGQGAHNPVTILMSGFLPHFGRLYLSFFTYSLVGKFLKAQQWLG